MGGPPKIGVFTPKMDGENKGKPYWHWWFGGPTPIFGNTHILLHCAAHHWNSDSCCEGAHVAPSSVGVKTVGGKQASAEIPSWEVTYPHPKYVWRWVSFSEVGYLSSLEGTQIFWDSSGFHVGHRFCLVRESGSSIEHHGKQYCRPYGEAYKKQTSYWLHQP